MKHKWTLFTNRWTNKIFFRNYIDIEGVLWYNPVVELVTLRKKTSQISARFFFIKIKNENLREASKASAEISLFQSGYINICCDDEDSQHNRKNEGEP